jgi:hypothetical protein
MRPGNLDANLVATCLAGDAGATHWAYGMPLSYVQEMASQWLSLYDQTARLAAPAGAGDNDNIPDDSIPDKVTD